MTEATHTLIGVSHYKVWEEAIEASVQLLKFKMAKSGIEMTDEECYAYMCWCYSNTFDCIMENVDPRTQDGLRRMVTSVAEGCSVMYKQFRTGKFQPPVGQARFDTIEQFEAAVRPKAPVSVETILHPVGGYL